ncbi:Methylamine utilisation protein MauE [Kytococcus aerolatus]|uniref:Methylamine utilisation protein MauE n=1 Tax=Kytococcus aerolatus TaxID=592308 RepID=A0A212T5I5_9MICO|nr:MauE/DoxX family redox-associated membrane protein [Kytococcus aerolatus]SNC61096.1 Methylamine utilisation protein MauE [Kytococcus aerolatus]
MDSATLPTAAAGAALLLALVYGTSGVAKVLDGESTRSAFRELRLPRWLSESFAPRLLGPAEILLAVLLLVLPHPWFWLPAVAALGLGIVYTVLIVRALGFDVPVTCGCFGRLGQGTVTRTTVVRNLLLVVLGAVAVADAATGGSVLARLGDTGTWWWLLVVLAAVALTRLIGSGEDESAPEGGGAASREVPDEELEDYLRLPVPFAEVTGADGPVQVRDLAAGRAWLMLWVSLGCGSCVPAIERAGRFAREHPEIGVMLVATTPTAQDDERIPEGCELAWDEHGQFRTMFQVHRSPSAVLLGADQLLAGGPVAGAPTAVSFIDDIEAELASVEGQARPPVPPVSSPGSSMGFTSRPTGA